MRQGLIGACMLVVAGAVACGGAAETAPATPVDFDAAGRAPRCDLKPNAPPEAVAAREKLMADWADAERTRGAWEGEIHALGTELGLDADEALITDAVTSAFETLVSRGCTVTCTPSYECDKVSLSCASDPGAQPAADKLAAAITRHWPKLRAMRDWKPGARYKALDGWTEPRTCDQYIFQSTAPFFLASNFQSALHTASSHGQSNDCPRSTATCKALCAQGNAVACASAASDDKLPAADRFDLDAKACEGKAGEGDEQRLDIACMHAFDKRQLDAYPEFKDRLVGIADRVCGGDVPTKRCASILASSGQHAWMRARPFYARIVATLPATCEAVDAELCGNLTLYMFGAGLDAGTLDKIAATMRKKCDGGAAKACTVLGAGVLPVPGPERAQRLVHGCQLATAECMAAAVCFEQGSCQDVAKDPDQARAAHRRICDDWKATHEGKDNHPSCAKAQ